ncbi:MAG: glycoside hydrolase domain-containing protein [Armatimonadota bacterium]
MNRIPWLIILLVITTASALTGATLKGYLPPVVVARYIEGGDEQTVSYKVWKLPVVIPRFENYLFGYLPENQTEVRLAYDQSNLYVAFRCFEEQMDRISTAHTERDSSVWKDDSVAVMLDTDDNPRTYYRLIANAAGVQADEKDDRFSPKSWDAQWYVKTGREKDAWTLLMIIPFKSLGVQTPRPGTSWGANFSRFCVPFKEHSIWTTVSGATYQPELWGCLVFGDAEAPIISVSPDVPDRNKEFAPCGSRAAGTCAPPATPISVPGPQRADIRISNPSSRDLKLVAQIIVDEKVVATHRTIVPPGEHVWRLTYIFPFEGEHQLKIGVVDQRTRRVLMRTPYQWVYIKKHSERVQQLRRMLAESKPVTPAAIARVDSARRLLDDLAGQVRSAYGNKARWEELNETIKKAEQEVGFARCLAADARGLGYVIGFANALTKVYRDEIFEGRFDCPVEISAARREFESAQAVVIAYDKALKGVSVSITPLAGPGGAVIPTDAIRLEMVDWVRTYPPRYAVEYIGWTPDPIVELKPFDLEKGALRPIWITVRPPDNVPAGLYKGKLVVRPKDSPESSIPVQVRVWNFTMPVRKAMKTAFAFFPHEMVAWYGEFTDDMKWKWYEFLLEHNINPTNIYSTKGPALSHEDLEFCVPRGLNAYTLICTWGKEGEALKNMLDMIGREWEYLKQRGWTDLPYVYGFDELGPDKYPELRDTYGAIKKAFPELPTMTTVHPNPHLKGYVDIWVPLTANWDLESHREYTKAGDEVWWYVCCHPFHPWPNFFIDYPTIDQRIIWWMNWKYQVPGFLYYAINLWDANYKLEGVTEHPDTEARQAIAEGKRWPEVPWNPFSCASFSGDGQLIYPGPGGKPYSSMRFEAIRDGIDDYEYFYQLNRLVDKAAKAGNVDRALLAKARKLLSVRDDVVTSTTKYTFDPERLYSARAEVAEMIEKLGGN